MANHWTYCDVDSADDLAQGDIIERSEELVSILQQVHGHFTDEKYLGFMVVTQSCDLVPRPKCKAHYISLAAIRPAKVVFSSLIKEICKTPVPGLLAEEHKNKAIDLISRVLNQNEQGFGLFYLHNDIDAGISEDAVALLRVTISLRAEHYSMIKEARVGRLTPQFQSKFGWLAGNLYGRVATPDWSDQEGGKEEQKRLVKTFLSAGDLSSHYWIPGKLIDTAEKKGVKLEGLQASEAIKEINQTKPPPPKTVALEKVRSEALKIFGESDESTVRKVEKLVQRLNNDTEFKRACKDR
ncbi:hypothetical protein CKO51_12720 [Rhodopirellula sp. SM50]|nr:hypothetical protein [Rhodopirellula sp. SM50]PAY19213.1 hypothetical protein CKO51_12720 [Rhodopirellula sp. SM50]